MYRYEDVRVVHLEITDKCNASCPMCPRNDSGGAVNPHLPLTELTLDQIKLIFPVEFITQLDRMYMCGNFGDPIVARDTLEVFQYFRQHNSDMSLGMNTNASAKKPEWWANLARVLGTRGNVNFSIDGLEDTNAIYRRGTNYQKAMENARAFIDSGGRARWEFIVFRHNEHQVEEAEWLAQEYGFEEFRPKKTGRFYNAWSGELIPAYDVKNRVGQVEYQLEIPQNPKWINQSLERYGDLVERFGSMAKYLDQTPIDCKVAREKSIYVSADGYIFPCCWTAATIYLMGQQEEYERKLLDQLGGVAVIDAKRRPIREIVEGEFFNTITRSWSCGSIAEGKSPVCAKTCGADFDRFKDQYR